MDIFKQPTIVIFLGLPGSGKTYFAKRLSEELRVVRLNSDALRSAIFGSRENAKQIYNSDSRPILNSYVFGAMDYATEELLALGQSVIQDANHNQRANRSNLEQLASRFDGRVILVHLTTPPEVATERAQQRVHGVDQPQLSSSEMEDVLHRHKETTDQPVSSELVIEIDGTAPFETQLAVFKKQLEKLV